MIADLINKDRQGFLDLCKQCHVSYIYAFGSSTRDDFRADIDVDVLLDVDVEDDLEAGRALGDIWNGLEKFFQRPVDLLTEDSLRNPYLRKEIERTKVLIYDGSKLQSRRELAIDQGRGNNAHTPDDDAGQPAIRETRCYIVTTTTP